MGRPDVRLIKPEAWAEKHFVEGSRPSEATVGRWMREGKVPARKIGGSWFVDELAWLAGDDDLVQQVLGVS